MGQWSGCRPPWLFGVPLRVSEKKYPLDPSSYLTVCYANSPIYIYIGTSSVIMVHHRTKLAIFSIAIYSYIKLLDGNKIMYIMAHPGRKWHHPINVLLAGKDQHLTVLQGILGRWVMSCILVDFTRFHQFPAWFQVHQHLPQTRPHLSLPIASTVATATVVLPLKASPPCRPYRPCVVQLQVRHGAVGRQGEGAMTRRSGQDAQGDFTSSRVKTMVYGWWCLW